MTPLSIKGYQVILQCMTPLYIKGYQVILQCMTPLSIKGWVFLYKCSPYIEENHSRLFFHFLVSFPF